MDDIELTKKIEALQWTIDLVAGTCKSDFVHYKIIKRQGYYDLKSTWISPDLPAVISVINDIQRSAVAALNNTKK